MPTGPILLCAALVYECRPLVRLLATPRHERALTGRSRWTGRVGDVDVVVQETGVGLDGAQATARAALAEVRPRCLLASGLAGGLSPAVAAGDAIVPDRVTREDSPPIAVDAALRTLAAVELPEGRSRRSLLVSVDRVVRTPAQKAALAAVTQADAVDMESAALLEAARAAAVPALVIRAASDTATDELPDMAGLDLTRLRDQLRLTGRALGSPATARNLARLARGSHRATQTLARVLQTVLPRLQF